MRACAGARQCVRMSMCGCMFVCVRLCMRIKLYSSYIGKITKNKIRISERFCCDILALGLRGMFVF